MSNSANIVAGKPLATGGVRIGPLGTTAPTNATTALAVGFVSAGYVGEDGLTETVDRSTEKVKAWGGDIVKVLQTDYSVSYQFTFLETLNTDVLRTVYGDANVTVTPGTPSAGTLRAVKLNSDELPHKAFVFDMKDGNARIRIHVPDGQINDVGEVTYNDGELVGYQVTIEAFRDATLGAQAIKYIDDGVFIPA
jgi:hypothetical protein